MCNDFCWNSGVYLNEQETQHNPRVIKVPVYLYRH
jgi:hypothetical protein